MPPLSAPEPSYSVQFVKVLTGRDRIVYAVVVGAALVAITRYALWWFHPEHVPANWDGLGPAGHWLNVIYFAMLTFVVWRGLFAHLFHFWLVPSMVRPLPIPAPPGVRVALLTCFVPGKEPIDVLERCLRSLLAVRYPHDTWVLDEGDDVEVKQLCTRLGVRHFSRHGIPEFNQSSGPFLRRTKAGNHNAWHDVYGHKYDVVGQMDMDYVCQPHFLERTLGYFRDQRVAFVGGPQIYGNTEESFVARGAAQQAFIFHGALQMAAAGKGCPLFIGTVHAVRTEALRSIGGYAPHIVEDHLTGMRLCSRGWRAVYVPEVLAIGEGPTTWSAYFAQQMRWSYGCIDIFLRHTPRLWLRLPWRAKVLFPNFELHWFIGIAQCLGVLMTTIYFVFGWAAASMDLGDWIVHAFPPFILAWIFQYWLQRYNLRTEERGPNLEAHALMHAAWPVIALAFVLAALGRRLQYVVTPKGSMVREPEAYPFRLHQAMAVVAAVGLCAIPLTHHWAPQLFGWAVWNLVVMITLPAIWLAVERRTVQRPVVQPNTYATEAPL